MNSVINLISSISPQSFYPLADRTKSDVVFSITVGEVIIYVLTVWWRVSISLTAAEVTHNSLPVWECAEVLVVSQTDTVSSTHVTVSRRLTLEIVSLSTAPVVSSDGSRTTQSLATRKQDPSHSRLITVEEQQAMGIRTLVRWTIQFLVVEMVTSEVTWIQLAILGIKMVIQTAQRQETKITAEILLLQLDRQLMVTVVVSAAFANGWDGGRMSVKFDSISWRWWLQKSLHLFVWAHAGPNFLVFFLCYSAGAISAEVCCACTKAR